MSVQPRSCILYMYLYNGGPMENIVSISDARARLPELAKHLANNPEDVVIIEHRDLPERIVMVNENYLRFLETLVKEKVKPKTGGFRLAGSITSDLSDDELDAFLEAMRVDAAERAREKFRDINEP